MIQGIGFRRVDTPKDKRKNTFVIIDEFQNFAISYVKNMLEEIRQYKIGFLMAQQYAGQGMDGDFLDSILTNTTLKIIGSNDPNTFRELAKSTGISETQLKALPKHNFFVFNRDANVKPEQKFFQMKTPDILVNTKNTAFYLDNDQYKDLLKFLVFESGQYAKDAININDSKTPSVQQTAEPIQPPQTERKEEIETRNEGKPKPKKGRKTDETENFTEIPKPKFTL
jgi:hypothetical protein